MDTSPGTETWIAECERLFDRCVDVAERGRVAEARAGLDLLLGLLRHVDECHDDVVFFADEGGSYLVGVPWERVLPAYFAGLARDSDPDAYAEAVHGTIREFAPGDSERYLRAARAVATAAQKAALKARL